MPTLPYVREPTDADFNKLHEILIHVGEEHPDWSPTQVTAHVMDQIESIDDEEERAVLFKALWKRVCQWSEPNGRPFGRY